jgi:ribosomal protein L37E
MQQQPESALPRCPMCGAALQSTATACPACGTPLAGLVLTPRTPTAFATAPAALPTTPAAPSATEPAPTAVADAATADATTTDATTTDATTTDATDATERCDWCGQVSPAGDEQCAHCGAMFPRPETDAALLRQADERRRAEMESLMTMRRRHQRKGLGRLFSN